MEMVASSSVDDIFDSRIEHGKVSRPVLVTIVVGNRFFEDSVGYSRQFCRRESIFKRSQWKEYGQRIWQTTKPHAKLFRSLNP